jgi:hypothetical protein
MRKWLFIAIAGYLWKKFGAKHVAGASRGASLRR